MKYFYTLLLGLLLGASAIGQETPAITMTTALPVGSTISFRITNLPTEVDFGDGIKTQFNTVDITGTVKNSQIIKIYGTEIRSLDCMNIQLTGLDVTKCPSLNYIRCGFNLLKELNVKNNTSLIELECKYNHIKELDISQNMNLSRLDIGTNYFTYATLPERGNLLYYYYSPQKPINIAKSITTQTVLDLSSQYSIRGNTTTYIWMAKKGNRASDIKLFLNTDYTITEGRTTFLKSQVDSVYCLMYNTLYPEFSGNSSFVTTCIKIVPATKNTQTINFSPLPTKTAGDPPFTLSATTSSNLQITYTSSDASIASISGNMVTIHKSGTVTITASQAGDSNWEAASTTQTLTITAAAATKKAQTITFDPITAKKVGDTAFDLKATASSNLAVSFASDNSAIASVSGIRVTILKAGTVNITASQSGNGDWNAAEPVTQTLTIGKKAQIISFEAISAKKIKDGPFTLKASSSSNLPITYTSSDPLVASVNGSTVTILKAGTVTITATQAGNEEWEPISATQKLTISATTGINDEEEENLSIYPNPVTETLYIKGKWLENTNAFIFNAMGTKVWSGSVTGQSINVSQLPAGIYLLRISHKNEVKTIRFEKQ